MVDWKIPGCIGKCVIFAVLTGCGSGSSDEENLALQLGAAHSELPTANTSNSMLIANNFASEAQQGATQIDSDNPNTGVTDSQLAQNQSIESQEPIASSQTNPSNEISELENSVEQTDLGQVSVQVRPEEAASQVGIAQSEEQSQLEEISTQAELAQTVEQAEPDQNSEQAEITQTEEQAEPDQNSEQAEIIQTVEQAEPDQNSGQIELVQNVDQAESEQIAEQGQTNESDNRVIVGLNPGDAVCLKLNQNVDFGSVSHAHWGEWLSGEPRFSIGREFLSVEDEPNFGKVLRQKFVPNYKGTEWVAMGANIEGHRTYRISQSVFFEEGFDWGGEKYQGGKLGFGFGSGTYPTGGKDDPNGFTARLVWKGNRDGTAKLAIYSYAADRATQYGEDVFLSDAPAAVGEWVDIIMEITANSATDKYDGSMRGWINGNLVLEKRNMGWQLAGDVPSIDSIFYMGFYGGSGWDWAPDQTTYMKVGNICWAPVVEGYSGIDPDVGRTLIDQDTIESAPYFDQSDNQNGAPVWQQKKNEVADLIGWYRLLLQFGNGFVTSDGGQEYYRVMDDLNMLLEQVSLVTESGLPSSPLGHLEGAIGKLENVLSIQQNYGALFYEIESVLAGLKSLRYRMADLAISVAQNSIAKNGCSDFDVSISCLNSLASYNDAVAAREQLNFQNILDDTAIAVSSDQVWENSYNSVQFLIE